MSRHQRFLHWIDQVAEPFLHEWVSGIQREIPAYVGMEASGIHAQVSRHLAALRYYWDHGTQNLMFDFYSELARRRLSEQIRLTDVSRAVAVGERLLLERLATSRLPGKETFRELVTDTFREGSYILLECYQAAVEERAASAQAKIAATEADAAKTWEEYGLLNQILSGIDVGIVLLDAELKVVWLNATMPKELLRVRPELAVGRPCQEVLAHEAAECSRCSVCNVLEGSKPMRHLVRAKAGERMRDFLKITRPISGGQLKGRHAIEIYLDITAQQDTLRALARTQELVRNIFNSSVNGIISTDLKGRITLFNRTAESIFGYAESEVLRKPVADFYQRGKPDADRVMRMLLKREVWPDVETAFKSKSGEFVPIRVTFSLLKDEQGKLIGTMGFCNDLRVEEALKKEVASRDQYLLSILQSSMDGLVTLDARGRIASWNRGASALFGVEAKDALGHPIEDFLPAGAIQEMPSGQEPRGTMRFEARIPQDCDCYTDLLVTRTEIQDPIGGEPGASLVLKEVTELKRLQRELSQAEHLAEIGRLAASVAHEIKNPIAGLKGAMEMMRGVHVPGDPRFALFQEAFQQLRRLDSLVKDLLAFAKPVILRREPLPLALVVESSLPFVQESAADAGVELSQSIPDDLPNALADPQQIQQVLVNLILNAIQAVPVPGGSVRVSARQCGGELALEVSDTGAGIPPQAQKQIFQPFFTTKHIGTGLGLSIVQRIINAHGGRIEVASRVGKGTTFTVYLPADARSA